MPATTSPPPAPAKRRVKVIYVRVELSVAEGMAEAAAACGVSLSRCWDRAGERYLIDFFGRPDKAAAALP